MPELPDVEIFRRYLAATSLHKKITGVEVRSPRILDRISIEGLKKAAVGKSLEKADRHGKYLFGTLNSGEILALHFGMTGFLRYFKNPEKEPDHGRLVLHFKNRYRLVYDNQRLLGKITLAPDRDDFIRKKELGPDAMELSLKEFDSILGHGRGSLKHTLMKQNLLAGIGNIYADEILFQARMHPEFPTEKTDPKQRRSLYRAMRHVLDAAVKSRALPERMPKNFLLSHRNDGDRCPRCGGRIRKLKVSGRSAYVCPSCQKEK